MTAVTYANTKLEVVDQPTSAPAKRQLLIDVLRCGICGSDLPRATLDQIPDHRRRLLQGESARSNRTFSGKLVSSRFVVRQS